MFVEGTIKDAATEMPISKAKVSLSIGDKELAVLKSNRKGKFEYEEAASYIGETLICQVEKEKYHPQTVTYKIEHDEVHLKIKLVPLPVPDKEKKPPPPPPKKFNWLPPILGLIGGAFGGLIGTLILITADRLDLERIIISLVICGTTLGAALGIGLGDKKKTFILIIAGIVGCCIGVLTFVFVPHFTPVGGAIVGLAFGISLKKYKKIIRKLVLAGVVGGIIALAIGFLFYDSVHTNDKFHLYWPLIVFIPLGLSFGFVLGFLKDKLKR